MFKATARIDLVRIRKSTDEQANEAQIANVESMLADLGVEVPKSNWIIDTVSRRKVSTNEGHRRLMAMVEEGQVGTVYIESQTRWGTKDRPELFSLIGTFRKHGTRLFDLRGKQDLTDPDIAIELMAFMGSYKSEKELRDLSYNALRSKVNNFKQTGTWPTGAQPFGYGKACYSPEGTLLWTWQPRLSLSKGQLFVVGADGKLVGDRETDAKIRRKERGSGQKTVLIPSDNPAFIESVKLIFDLYTRVSLSRRAISAKLNQEGRLYYTKPFTHGLVTEILKNPAYAGDSHFGRTQTGELNSFDAKGAIVEFKTTPARRRRGVAERLVKKDTHEALIDPKTWRLAQAKLAVDLKRQSYSPRNAAYYLKQMLVCGHCGKFLVGRTEIDPKTKGKKVVYVCGSYVNGKASGIETKCGYHRITHDEAEQMILAKLAERDVQPDDKASQPARVNLKKRLDRLGEEDAAKQKEWLAWAAEGVEALAGYMKTAYKVDAMTHRRLRVFASQFYAPGDLEYRPLTNKQFAELPVTLKSFQTAISEAERRSVEAAKQELGNFRRDLEKYTKGYLLADSQEQTTIAKQLADKTEAEIKKLEPQTVPLCKRLGRLYDAAADRDAERSKLRREWPALENREKGESLRRLVSTVKLFWKRQFRPALSEPTRPRSTDRPGRYKYTLQKHATEWAFNSTDGL